MMKKTIMLKNNRVCLMFKILLLCSLPFSAYALKGDESQPLTIVADSATFDQKNQVTVFSGNLVITKGALIVHASQGTASQDKGGDRTLKLVGAPVTFVQKQDDGGLIEGQGNNFDYNTKTSLAVLTGRARVKNGKNIVLGDILTYNTTTHVYSAAAPITNGVTKKKSGRITVILDGQGNGTAAIPK